MILDTKNVRGCHYVPHSPCISHTERKFLCENTPYFGFVDVASAQPQPLAQALGGDFLGLFCRHCTAGVDGRLISGNYVTKANCQTKTEIPQNLDTNGVIYFQVIAQKSHSDL